jgi:hypothetical protein
VKLCLNEGEFVTVLVNHGSNDHPHAFTINVIKGTLRAIEFNGPEEQGESPATDRQQLKAAIILLDKLLEWDNGDHPGSVNFVGTIISEWRKIKAAI